MDNPASSTREKALARNLDATTYGTFAEIGGGQAARSHGIASLVGSNRRGPQAGL